MSPVQLFFLLLLVILLLLIGGLLLGSSSGSSASQSSRRRKRRQRLQNDYRLGDERYTDAYGEPIQQEEGNDRQSIRSSREPLDRYSSNERSADKGLVDAEPIVTMPGNSVDYSSVNQSQPPVSLRSRSKLYHYTAFVTSVYDGDTLTVDIDLGMDMHIKNQVIRLWKINTPEVRGATRQEGLEVRDLVRELVLNKSILLRTILDKRGRDQTGKYGRLLGEILLEDDSGVINVNEYLLAKGLAIPFGADGSAIKIPVPAGIPQRSGSPSPDDFPEDAPWGRGRGSVDKASEQLPAAQAGEMACPYCGEDREVNPNEGMVLACPNCMDTPYSYEEDHDNLPEFESH